VKTVTQKMQDRWNRYRAEAFNGHIGYMKIIGLAEALEVAKEADKRIAELEMKLLLLEEV
jgi:hypothetical protein